MGLLKKTLIIGCIRLLAFVGLFLFYLSRVNISPEMIVNVDSYGLVTVCAESPLGGNITLTEQTSESCFSLNGRFGKAFTINGDTSNIKITLVYNDTTVILDSKALTHRLGNTYEINSSYYPRYPLFSKLQDLTKVRYRDMIYTRAISMLEYFLKIAGICLLAVLFLMGLKQFFWIRKKIVTRIGKLITDSVDFIRQKHIRLLIPFSLSLVPGILYGIADPNALRFLALSLHDFMWITSGLLLPGLFCLWFSRPLKLNQLFWLSFVAIVIVNAFILFPQMYIYGIGFKEDIKFFIKLFNYQTVAESLFTPSSGYLSIIQGFIPWLTGYLLGFKHYLPESLQVTSILLSSIMFASFNLKIFRNIIKNDKIRFAISLLAGIFKIGIPELWFIYDSLFFAAVLLWLLLFCIDKMSITGYTVFVIAFVCLIFSKPIFFVFVPAFIFLFALGVVKKNKRYLMVSLTMLLAIGVQMALYMTEPVYGGQTNTNNALGTNYISEFSENSISWFSSIVYGVYIFIRMPLSLFLSETRSGLLQIIINSASFIFIAGISGYMLFRVIRYKEIAALVILFGNILSYSSAVLFVKVVADNFLMSGNQVVRDMSFIELINSGYLVPYQRYLIIGFIPLLVSLGYALFLITKKLPKKAGVAVLIVLPVILIVARTNRHILNMQQVKAANPALFIKPSQSLWRQYDQLIFEHQDAFYIPYYGYPVQTECLRNGIDRITDLYPDPDGKYRVSAESFDCETWQTIEIITETNGFSETSVEAYCITTKNDSIHVIRVQSPEPPDRFLIFRMNDFYTLKEIIFVNGKGAIINNNKPVRLVGHF